MLEYARTKALAELLLRDDGRSISTDIYRIAVAVDFNRPFEFSNWTQARKIGAAYRRTHYIYILDLVAALAHLAMQGILQYPIRVGAEAFNICDEDDGRYLDLLTVAYRTTRDQRFRTMASIPLVLDLSKNVLKYGIVGLRPPFGALRFSNEKLLATGFKFPVGVKAAFMQALEKRVLA
jgi:nucleoside-diphosphate-sugar epimerase